MCHSEKMQPNHLGRLISVALHRIFKQKSTKNANLNCMMHAQLPWWSIDEAKAAMIKFDYSRSQNCKQQFRNLTREKRWHCVANLDVLLCAVA